MARHPWVAEADHGVRFGVQLVVRHGGLPALLGTGRMVESLGFDGLFIFDHPAVHADPWVCLPALAAVTERVRLGSVVNCVPYRHPAYLARIASDLDNLSGGRLILGVGAGWLESEFRALDVPFAPIAERQAALDEALTIIEGVWGPEPFSFAGSHVRTEAMHVVPPPVQKPRPPVMIGGGGERRTLRLVARRADACNVSELRRVDGRNTAVGGAETVRHKLQVLEQHCAEVGRPYDEILRTHFTIRLLIAPTEGELAAKLERANADLSTSPGTQRADPSATVAGLPDQIVEHYQAFVDVGIQYFVMQVDSADHETLALLATEVMPHVR